MKRLHVAVLSLALLLIAGCSQPKAHGESIQKGSGAPCPYAGAVVDVTYQKEADLATIRQVFVSMGWKQTNTEVREVINGTLDGAGVSALVRYGKTLISVHVLHSQNEADYPTEDKEAEALLRSVKARVEEALGLAPSDNFVHRINRGCEG